MERLMPRKGLFKKTYYLLFTREGGMPFHTGPYGEATLLERKQK